MVAALCQTSFDDLPSPPHVGHSTGGQHLLYQLHGIYPACGGDRSIAQSRSRARSKSAKSVTSSSWRG